MQIKHKYGMYYKYNKNFSCGAMTNDKFTDLSLHSEICVNKKWRMFLNYMKTDDIMMRNMGMGLDISWVNLFNKIIHFFSIKLNN